jgi:hypothetical protein
VVDTTPFSAIVGMSLTVINPITQEQTRAAFQNMNSGQTFGLDYHTHFDPVKPAGTDYRGLKSIGFTTVKKTIKVLAKTGEELGGVTFSRP